MKPKSLKIGRKQYAVAYQTVPWVAKHGEINEGTKKIKIATRHCFTGRKRSKREQMGTFWHELTHGILIDMNHPLWNNERFVVAFATRLHRAIDSTVLG